MKRIAFAFILSVIAPAAFAQWTQNNLVNLPGGGTGGIAGADLSQLEATPVAENVFGFGSSATAGVVIADDFTVGAGGWNVTGLRFYLYQTGATAPSITGVNWAIDAAPSLTLTSATPDSVGWWSPNGVGVYRTVNGNTTDTSRRVQEVFLDVSDFFLGAGTYWLSYSTLGSVASGPWAPPIPSSQAVNGLNAQQSLSGGAFAQVFVDAAGTVGGDLPFVIEAQPVPEPASMAALGLGVLALIRRRRANK